MGTDSTRLPTAAELAAFSRLLHELADALDAGGITAAFWKIAGPILNSGIGTPPIACQWYTAAVATKTDPKLLHHLEATLVLWGNLHKKNGRPDIAEAAGQFRKLANGFNSLSAEGEAKASPHNTKGEITARPNSEQPAESTADLIERLLAGPDDVELTPRELAFLAAHLRNNRPQLSWWGQQNRGEKCPELERHQKLKTILDFNQNLRALGSFYPPTTASSGNPTTLGDGEGTGGDRTQREESQAAEGKAKRGRRVDKATIRRADFAKPLREKGMTWDAIAAAYAKKNPRDIDASADTIRLAFQRQYPEPK